MAASVELLPVMFPGGQKRAYLATLSQLRAAEHSGVLRVYGSKRKIHGGILFDGPVRPRCGQRDTHNHETDDNPRGVWTFRQAAGNRPDSDQTEALAS